MKVCFVERKLMMLQGTSTVWYGCHWWTCEITAETPKNKIGMIVWYEGHKNKDYTNQWCDTTSWLYNAARFGEKAMNKSSWWVLAANVALQEDDAVHDNFMLRASFRQVWLRRFN